MKRYVGTKTLFAQPMTRGDYNAYRGWTIPEGEDPADAGYLVEYEDGGKANDSRHAGYISWSPADVFERTYREEPADFKARVRAEHAELAERITKLVAFLHTKEFSALPLAERDRLRNQHAAMSDYRDCLEDRIAAFS